MIKSGQSTRILGVNFFTGTAAQVVEAGARGGLVVVPSAPVLVRMEKDPALRAGLLGADLAIADSGFMVLIWWLLTREKVVRVSGLEYLQLLLSKLKHERSVLWVMPNVAVRDRNLAWLQANGHATKPEDCYVAPMYPSAGPLRDRALLDWIRALQPRHIIICIGGGVQERLGFFLKRELERGTGSEERGAGSVGLPGIHCVGAAIGFLSGDQVRIPMWADFLYLGWLFRCISSPRGFVPRYWKAMRLVRLLWRYGKEAPPA